MSSDALGNVLKSLENLKKGYTCRHCSQLCKKPVTLKLCLHIICEEHLDNLEKCPTCNIPLTDKSVFRDDRLEACINSTKELEKIFTPLKAEYELKSSNECSPITSGSSKRGKATNAADEKENIKDLEKSQKKINTRSATKNISLVSTASSSKVNKVVEKRNMKGETPLHVACCVGNLDKITELLNSGANPNTKDNAGWTPLHEAVHNNRLDIVQKLLQHNALINVPGLDNESPLHEAVKYKFVDIVKVLIKNGAELNARNSKGETPLDIASEEIKKIMKEAEENIIQTQTVNVMHVSEMQSELDFEDIYVYCVSQYRSVLNKLKSLVKHHSNVHIEMKLSKKVTHLIVDADDSVCMSSLDILQGIVYRIWIISTQWVTKCTDEKLQKFSDYEIRGVGTLNNDGPRNARYSKYKLLPGLFNGCHFYLHNFNTKYEISKTIIVNKVILSKLITDAGGIVLRRVPNPESIPEAEKVVPYHAKKGSKLEICSHYIIFRDVYEPMYNMKHIKALPVGWLIECIEKYELCDP